MTVSYLLGHVSLLVLLLLITSRVLPLFTSTSIAGLGSLLYQITLESQREQKFTPNQ